MPALKSEKSAPGAPPYAPLGLAAAVAVLLILTLVAASVAALVGAARRVAAPSREFAAYLSCGAWRRAQALRYLRAPPLLNAATGAPFTPAEAARAAAADAGRLSGGLCPPGARD